MVLQFLSKDRDSQVTGLHSLHHAELQYFHNLFHGCAGLQGVLDMPSGAGRVHVGERGVESNAEQFDFLGGQNTKC